jgi:hypothetical protein
MFQLRTNVSMSEFIDAMRLELSALEAELEDDPRYRKIVGLRALISEYTNNRLAPKHAARLPALSPTRAPQINTKKARIHDVIRDILIARGPVHRSDLLQAIEDQGLIVSQKNPMLALASYLSDFKDFRSAGQGIWTLAEPTNSEASTADAVEAS